MNNPAAFPRPMTIDVERETEQYAIAEQDGMTLRDYFAGQALAGYTSSVETLERAGSSGLQVTEALAIMAYEVADAMLNARGQS